MQSSHFLLVSLTAREVLLAKSRNPMAGFVTVPTMPLAKPEMKP